MSIDSVLTVLASVVNQLTTLEIQGILFFLHCLNPLDDDADYSWKAFRTALLSQSAS